MVSESVPRFPLENASEMYCNDDNRSISSCDSNSTTDYDGTTIVLRDDVKSELPACYGNVSLNNSHDIQFGNKTFYQGPVTIKQLIYTNKPVPNGSATDSFIGDKLVIDGHGVDNPGFSEKDERICKGNEGNAQKCNGAKNTDIKPENRVNKGVLCLVKFAQEHSVLLVGLLALVMVSLVILIALLVTLTPTGAYISVNNKTAPYFGDTDEQEKNTPIDAPYDPDANLTLPNKLKLVPRLGWLAQPPEQPATKLQTPVPYVIISHTATENCSSQSQCIYQVRFIQTFHIESFHWWDIGYNFLVGGNGEAYEGRGWSSEGAHTFGYNSKAMGIAFIGTFNNLKPPARQIRACQLLIAKGVELGFIRKDYKLLGARQLQTTLSPGQVLYDVIKTWDHWAPNP